MRRAVADKEVYPGSVECKDTAVFPGGGSRLMRPDDSQTHSTFVAAVHFIFSRETRGKAGTTGRPERPARHASI